MFPFLIKGHRRQDTSNNRDGKKDQAAHDPIGDGPSLISGSGHEVQKRTQKRYKNVTGSEIATGSKSTPAHNGAGGCSILSQKPPDSGFSTTSGEAQVFSQGIFCIQPDSPRHAYFITFLDVVQPPSMPLTPKTSPEKSSSSGDGSSRNQSGSRQVARKRRHKRIPYSPAENRLLAELKSQHDLPWRNVATHFKPQCTKASDHLRRLRLKLQPSLGYWRLLTWSAAM